VSSATAADGQRGGIGVLGSAFNPPHLGHLALAQEALWQLDLDEVVLVPTGEAPHKRIHDDPGRKLRLAMTRLAAADDPRFAVSTLEVEREGPSYTYETLELLAAEKGDPELVFVMGADAAVGFESWREPRRVVELARLAVARRAGISEADVAATMRAVDAAARVTMLEMPQFGVSSSAVRERAAAGRPLRYMVPEAVARFIEEKGIYS
jgi:nicotinate-nucleotide adenylyltransferase